jgi:ketosteroid isomerase-like protein
LREIELLLCMESSTLVRDTERTVSQENVKLVRSLYESGLMDRDPEELLKLATPDIEYVNPSYAVEPGVRRGLVAVAQAMRRFAEPWEESRHELRELYDSEDIVVAAVSWHIRSRGSERELVNEEAHTWTLRAGRIARFEWGQDLETALEAAGASGFAHSPRLREKGST